MCVYVGHYEALYFHVVHLSVCLYSHARTHGWAGTFLDNLVVD